MASTPGTRVIFSPKGGTSKELARLIKAAKKEIVVAAYAFSSKYLGQALSGALKRGVKIRVLLDGDNARKSYSIDEWLVGEGIGVRFIEIKRGPAAITSRTSRSSGTTKPPFSRITRD